MFRTFQLLFQPPLPDFETVRENCARIAARDRHLVALQREQETLTAAVARSRECVAAARARHAADGRAGAADVTDMAVCVLFLNEYRRRLEQVTHDLELAVSDLDRLVKSTV